MFEKEIEKKINILFSNDNFVLDKKGALQFVLGIYHQYCDNKANEWRYVEDGLPKDNEYVLIYTNLNNCYVAKKVENHFMSKGWGFIPMSTVIAWKEIVLPELPKEIKE